MIISKRKDLFSYYMYIMYINKLRYAVAKQRGMKEKEKAGAQAEKRIRWRRRRNDTDNKFNILKATN